MKSEINILLPLAGTLFGLVLSLLLARLRTVSLAGYSRKTYRSIESADLKSGIVFTIIAMLLISSVPLIYNLFRLPVEITTAPTKPDTWPIDSLIFRPPPPIDPGKPSDPVAFHINNPVWGTPKPIPDDQSLPEDNITPDEALNIYARQATPDSIIRMIAQAKAKDDEMPEPNTFVAYDRAPQAIDIPRPYFPEVCLKAGIGGMVVVNLLLNKKGEVVKVMLLRSSGNPALDEAALEAARRARFTPAYQGDSPVSVWVSLPFTFKVAN